VVLTPEQAGEILKAIRKSSLKQLRGQRPRPQAKTTAWCTAYGSGDCPPRQGSLSNTSRN